MHNKWMVHFQGGGWTFALKPSESLLAPTVPVAGPAAFVGFRAYTEIGSSDCMNMTTTLNGLGPPGLAGGLGQNREARAKPAGGRYRVTAGERSYPSGRGRPLASQLGVSHRYLESLQAICERCQFVKR